MIVFRIIWVWFDCRIIAFDLDLMSVLKTGAVFLVVDEIGVLCMLYQLNSPPKPIGLLGLCSFFLFIISDNRNINRARV